MKQSDLIHLPFLQIDSPDSTDINSTDHSKATLNSIYQSFHSKRNASRIDRYFIYLRKSRMRNIVFFIALFLLVVVLSIFIMLTRGVFVEFADDLKDSMMYSIFDYILSSVDFLIVEPNFFCSFLVTFFKNSQLPLPSKETANMYASILTSANQASASTVYWWKIGVPDNTFIGVKTYESRDNIEWFFSESNEDGTPGGFYLYQVDQYFRNSSYPEMIGDSHPDIAQYDLQSIYWYDLGVTTKHAIWSNLYFPLMNFAPIFSSVISSWSDEPSSLQYVLALDLRLSYVQNFLARMLPTPGSRLAITSSDGFVVAIAGSDPSLEESYLPGIITKGIDQLSDPVWRCVSSDPRYRQKVNFSVKCIINETSLSYQVIRNTVHFSETSNWTVHAVLKLDDVDQAGESIYNFSFISTSAICLLLYLICAFISHVIIKQLKTEQTKLLLSESHPEKKNYHIRPIGIIQAFSDLRRISLASAKDNEIIEELNSSMNLIISSSDMYYYDSQKFVSKFNDKIREKMIDVFGFDKNSLILSNELEEKSEMNFFDDDNILTSFIQHNDIRKSDYSSMFTHILSIGLRINENNNYIFDNEKFISFLNYHLALIPHDLFFLATDSFDFLELVMKWKPKDMFDQQLIEMAMYITMIAFYLAMNDRFNSEFPYIRRYFLTDYINLLDILNKMLIQLPSMMLTNNDFELAKENWKSISKYAHFLVEMVPVSRHIELVNKCRIFIHPGSRQISMSKSIDLMRFLFNTATNSALLAPPEHAHYVHSFLYSFSDQKRTNDGGVHSPSEKPRMVSVKFDNSTLIDTAKPLSKPVKDFIKCLNKVYLAKVTSALNQICGEFFVQYLLNPSVE